MVIRFGLLLIFLDFMPVISNMICRITMHFLLTSYLLILKVKKANYMYLMSFKSEIGHLELLLLAVLKIEFGTLFIAGQTLYH